MAIINNNGTQQDPNNTPDTTDPTNTAAVGRTTPGTGFTNIDQILNANQGAGNQMGTNIGQGLTSAGQGLIGQGNQSYSTFQGQYNQGVNPANAAISTAAGYEQQPGESTTAYYNRLAQSGSYGNVGNNLRSAAYTGPTGLTNATQLQGQANSLSDLASMGSNTQGQQGLLGSYVANRASPYTSGESALDQMLLGQSGQSAINKGSNYISANVPNQINNLISQAGNEATTAKLGITGQQAAIGKNFTNALSGNNGIEALGTGAASADQAEMLRVSSILNGQFSGQITPADRAAISNLQQYGVNFNTPLTSGGAPVANTVYNSAANSTAMGLPVANTADLYSAQWPSATGPYAAQNLTNNNADVQAVGGAIGSASAGLTGKQVLTQGNQLAEQNLAALTGQTPSTPILNNLTGLAGQYNNAIATAGAKGATDFTNQQGAMASNTNAAKTIQQQAAAAQQNVPGANYNSFTTNTDQSFKQLYPTLNTNQIAYVQRLAYNGETMPTATDLADPSWLGLANTSGGLATQNQPQTYNPSGVNSILQNAQAQQQNFNSAYTPEGLQRYIDNLYGNNPTAVGPGNTRGAGGGQIGQI